LWKLVEEIRTDDYVALQRTPQVELGPADWHDVMEALLLGAFVSEGYVSETQAGFANLDRDYFAMVAGAYDAVIGGKRCIYQTTNASGSRMQVLYIQNVTALKQSPLWEMVGCRSANKYVPEWMWHAPAAVKRVFLQALFEGDGSCSRLPRNTI